jgi:hypothetical protein
MDKEILETPMISKEWAARDYYDGVDHRVRPPLPKKTLEESELHVSIPAL